VNHSPFLTFDRNKDRFVAEANVGPSLAFLRVELSRVRVGMTDYLMKVATPPLEGAEGTNTVVVLRCNRKQASHDGAKGAATVVIDEMKARGDNTFKWETADVDHLTAMIAAHLKFFSTNTSSDVLQFSTEALR